MIQVSKKSAGNQQGPVEEVPVLAGACDRAELFRCTIQAGYAWKPPLFPRPAVTQMFLFLGAGGYVATPTQAFSITEPSLFVPDFDREEVAIQAGSQPLECIRIVSRMNEEDCNQIGKSHMVFPRFRPFSQAWEHTMRTIDAEGSNTRAFVLIENRKLGANNMGLFRSARPGASEVAEDMLPTYDQFIFCLEQAGCTLWVEEEETALREGDIAYIPHGSRFRFGCGPDGRIHHVWYALNRAYD